MLKLNDFKKIIEEIQEKDLFNKFIIDLFGYEEEELNKFIISYKFNNGFIIDIYDYNLEQKFIRYYFKEDNESVEVNEDNIIINKINIKEEYLNNGKYYLFSSLFYEKDKEIIINNLNNLFDKKIIEIILKNFSWQKV